MRGRHWTQCIRRGSVVLLLALAGFVSLAHAAQHLGEVSDCPMCVQGHASGPILERALVAALPTAPVVRAKSPTLPALENGRHTSPHAGRAPPSAIA